METYLKLKDLPKVLNYSYPSLRTFYYNNRDKVRTKWEKNYKLYHIDDMKSLLPEKKRVPISDSEIEEIYELYTTGSSIREIIEVTSRSADAIKDTLRKKGINGFNDYHAKLDSETKNLYQQMYKHYQDNKCSVVEVCKIFGYDFPNRFIHYIRRTGRRVNTYSDIRAIITAPDFFKNIESEIQAYLLGFFAADGHIEKRKDYDSYTLRVGVQTDDAHILMLYAKYLTDNQVSISASETKGQVTIAITSKEIGEDLLKLGYDNRKTYTCHKVPPIPKEYMHHFIRGFFDGDGSIIVNRRIADKRLSGYNKSCVFTGHNKDLLKDVISQIGLTKGEYKFTEKKPHSREVKGNLATFGTNWIVNISNRQSLIKVYNYLYKDANFYFKRKKDKFDLAILTTEETDAVLQGNL